MAASSLSLDAAILSWERAAGTSDAIDAAVVAMAGAGDRIVTSDKDDLQALVNVSARSVLVVAV